MASDEVRAAAERVRTGPAVASLADFILLADAYLSEHPADEDQPIDVMLLASRFDELGNLRNQRQFVIRSAVSVFALACEGPKCWRFELWCGDQKVKDDPTRGDLRRLCAALNIPLPEQPQ